MRYYKTHGIILRIRKSKDKDRIVTLLTPDRGKITAVSRGSRDPKSKHCGIITEYHHISTQLYTGKSLPTMTQSQLLRSYLPQRNLSYFARASLIAETLDTLLEEEQYIDNLFPFVEEVFSRVRDDDDPFLPSLFTIKALSLLGYAQEFHLCSQCHSPLRESSSFSLNESWQVVCSSCSHDVCRSVPVELIKLLSFVQQHDFAALRKISLPQTLLPLLDECAKYMFYQVTHRERKSEAFLSTSL